MKEAEKKYTIPRTTLNDKLNGKSALCSKPGPATVLTHQEEKLLKMYIDACRRDNIPVNRKKIEDIIEEMLRKEREKGIYRKLPTTFKNGKPGKTWFQLFFKRHNLKTNRKKQIEKGNQDPDEDVYNTQFANFDEFVSQDNILRSLIPDF